MWRPAIGLLIWLTGATVASAQIYRWVDSEGRVHYSDQLPAGTAADRVELAPAPALPPARPATGRSSGMPPPPAAASAPMPVAVPGPGRDQVCAAARMDLAVLSMDRPVYRDDAGALGVFWAVGSRPNYYEGEREYLSDPERRDLAAGLRSIVDRDCRVPDEAAAQAAAESAWLHAEDCRAMRHELEQLRRRQMRTAESDLARKERETEAFCAGAAQP